MPQRILQMMQNHPHLQSKSRMSMPQNMRRDCLTNTSPQRQFTQQTINISPLPGPTGTGDKDKGRYPLVLQGLHFFTAGSAELS